MIPASLPHQRGDWLSAHLFFSVSPAQDASDDLLIDFIVPFVNAVERAGYLRSWFFIRYSERGPHLRLRLLPAAGVEPSVIRRELQEAALKENIGLHVGQFPSGSDASTRTGVATHLCWVEYEREIERYGGPGAIDIAEEFFNRSSRTAVDIVRRTRGDRPRRLGQAMAAMLCTMHAFLPTRAAIAAFAHDYATRYLRASTPQGRYSVVERSFADSVSRQLSLVRGSTEGVLKCLDEAGHVPSVLAFVRTAAGVAHAQLRELEIAGQLKTGVSVPPVGYITHILSSYLHMGNNRLGIGLAEEAFLAFAIAVTVPTDNPA